MKRISERMSKEFKARSPGKLILSGEHAVVYGAPAIALAVDCYAETTIRSHFTPTVFFNLLNLKYAKSLTLSTLFSLKHELQEQYRAFLEGKCSIREVLKRPFDLLQFTVTNLLEKWNVPLSDGVEIHTSSNIPIGAGMGSSAATVMSTLFALAAFFNLSIDPKRFLSLGQDAENLQHGRSSGLDLHLSLLGGCLKFEKGETEKRPLPTFPLNVVQTGKPDSTTGQCVSHASRYFEKTSLLDDYQAVTQQFDNALVKNDMMEIQRSIRENHRLLVEIGVVPPRIQNFIQDLEKDGAAAKICGAGSVTGDKAGVVLIVSEHDVEKVVERYGYSLQRVAGDLRGTRLVV